MIKVCCIYRHASPGSRMSIEKVFQTLNKEMPGNIVVEEFICEKSLFKTIQRLRRVKADIYHITGPNNYLAFFIPFRKKIVTIHDVYHWMHDLKGWRKFIFGLLYYYFPPRLCKVITTISDEVKKDMVKHFGIDAARIQVIANPLSHKIPYEPKPFNESRPVILQIGYNPHKNLANLVEAVKDIKCRLEIVGQPSPGMIQKMKAWQIDYRIQSNLSRRGLEQKYIEADIVFFASLYEGFGLPILEAQSAGRPLITSNLSPMKEIAGEGALLVDPKSPSDIGKAIMKIISNEALRNKLIMGGFANLKRYEPAAIAYQYAAAYEQMAGNKSISYFEKQVLKERLTKTISDY